MATTGSALATRLPARREVDLRDPVAAWLQARHRRLFGWVADEIDAGEGIADLVATYGKSVQERASNESLRHLSLQTRNEVELFHYLTSPRTESELRSWAPWGWRSLRNYTLIPMIDREIIHYEDSTYQLASNLPDPGIRITAVELKLKDWRRAVGQALRYHMFAHEVYVALPIAVAEKSIAESEELGIGVLGVTDSNCVLELVTPARNKPMDDVARRLAGEKSIATSWQTGRRIGGSPIR